MCLAKKNRELDPTVLEAPGKGEGMQLEIRGDSKTVEQGKVGWEAGGDIQRHLREWCVGDCVSARGPKGTFDGSAQDKSPCAVDIINECLVNGRVEGRTGVHVESEAVLKCEGNNNEGACYMLS